MIISIAKYKNRIVGETKILTLINDASIEEINALSDKTKINIEALKQSLEEDIKKIKL